MTVSRTVQSSTYKIRPSAHLHTDPCLHLPMSTVENDTISPLYGHSSTNYGPLRFNSSQYLPSQAALFFNGWRHSLPPHSLMAIDRRIYLILFAFVIFFLQKAKTRASRLFLILSVVLVLFALAHVVLDVTLAVIFLQVKQNLVDSGSATNVLSVFQTWVHIYEAREVLIAVNNTITDTVLISLKLYRSAAIWGSSRHSRIMTAFPSLLILSTLMVGLWGIFGIDTNTPIPFSLALVTNFLLLGLTAGRIWIKGRQATVVLGVQAGRRYNRTLEIMGLVITGPNSTQMRVQLAVLRKRARLLDRKRYTTVGGSPVTGVAWGALAQVVNTVPMMIIVRVGISGNTGEQEGNLRTFYGGNAGSFAMNTLLKSSAQ
ncbi:hypothetical protein B0H13DRAFT_1858797 [Mycena leptocephala]|nr:hypothetical protein B0H13DRAFT_1858797 [Mycena leptocephala]